MAIGLVVGSLLGAAVADQINGLMRQALIDVAALLVACKMLFLSNKEKLGKPLPSAPNQVGAGGGIGMASAILNSSLIISDVRVLDFKN